jgi:hypothetical protein
MKNNFNLTYNVRYLLVLFTFFFVSNKLYSQSNKSDTIYIKQNKLKHLEFFKNEKQLSWTEIKKIGKGNSKAEYHLKKIKQLKLMQTLNGLIAGLSIGFAAGNISNGNSDIPIIVLGAAGITCFVNIYYLDGIVRQHMKDLEIAINSN